MNAVKKLFVLTSAMAAMSASGLAMADTTVGNGHFYVSIRIMPTCNVATHTGTAAPTEDASNAANADIDFGDHLSSSSLNVERESAAGERGESINVTCTKGTPYWVSLTPTSTSSDNGTGKMSGVANSAAATSGDKISYSLYSDSARRNAWGNQKGVNALQGTGQGMSNTIRHPVYGKVAGSELDKTAGRYFDRVAVTLTY
ncbi:Uncharacterized secreted protein [Neisseria zoodegmatis]|uniref:Uncharacterized secreted protein n=1 Tax=Neisseria zoodegmatis TaxID=326523 RepID=A0A378WSF8_9NEIS|nr:spore coat U domain-containing protein [Neisseria zoodegmatis]SUA44069.1 Uncharacterized secreted protein [Neisseria zoodegmatis]